jgi:serine/threonine protein phosphatase PrpC
VIYDRPVRIRFAGLTDVGLQREHNEDAFVLLPEQGVMAVADGMGGHSSGERAARLAIDALTDYFAAFTDRLESWPFPRDPNLREEENQLVIAVRLANRAIFDDSRVSRSHMGQGSTIVAARFDERTARVAIAHAGDSRCYRIRDGEVTLLTLDHSLVHEYAFAMGELTPEEQAQIPRNVITRALGMSPDVQVDVLSHDTRRGDVYLVCSDGLSSHVSDDEIRGLVQSTETLEAACAALVAQANVGGGTDNITVAVARVEDV